MRLPTLSEAERAFACPPSQVLERVVDLGDEFSEAGTEKHTFMELVGELGREEALLRVPEKIRPACALIELDRLPVDPKAYASEVAVALDLVSGEAWELGRSLGRRYDVDRTRVICGTLDKVGVSADGKTVSVIDFKFGARRCKPVRRNWQIKLGLAAAARAYGCIQGQGALAYVSKEGEPWWDAADFDAFDLDAIVLDAQRLRERILEAAALHANGGTLPLVTGGHCSSPGVGCGSFHACPAQVGLAVRMATPTELEREIMAALTPETAPTAYRMLKDAEEVLDRIRKGIYGYALQNPIPLDDGRVLGPVETSREAVDGRTAHQVLLEKYGPEVAAAACDLKSSKAGIERALEAHVLKPGAKLAPLLREAVGAVRAAGGIEEHTSCSVKEHRPKRSA